MVPDARCAVARNLEEAREGIRVSRSLPADAMLVKRGSRVPRRRRPQAFSSKKLLPALFWTAQASIVPSRERRFDPARDAVAQWPINCVAQIPNLRKCHLGSLQWCRLCLPEN